MNMHRSALLASIVLLSACATKYQEPSPGTPFSTLTITSNHTGATNSNIYYVCTGAACKPDNDTVQLAAFSWATSDHKSVRLVAGDRIRIKALATNHLTGSTTIGNQMTIHGTQCSNILSFIPEDGHLYSLKQVLSSDKCWFKLLDTTTGKQPESFMPQ